MTTLDVGIHPNIPFDDYLAMPGLNASTLKHMRKSPAHLREAVENPPPATPAQILGTAAHAAILEPVAFGSQYVVAPKFDRRTKAGKAGWADWSEANADLIALPMADHTACRLMALAVEMHPAASHLIHEATGAAEAVGLWDDGDVDTRCKARFDRAIIHGEPYPNTKNTGVTIVDVKTAIDASPEGFAKALVNFGYDLQAAWYVRGAEVVFGLPATFCWVVVEKAPPYAVAVYEADQALIEAAWMEAEALLERYADCVAADHWPAYSGEIQTISLPAWRLRQLEEVT